MKGVRLLFAVSILATLSAKAHKLHGTLSEHGGMLLAFERRAVDGPATWRSNGSNHLTNRVSIVIEGNLRVIRANGIPDHPTGSFPNANNPNRIAPQDHEFKVTLVPKAATVPTPIRMQPFGIAVNGVLFDPSAAEWWNRDRESGWQYEPLTMPGKLGADENNAHVQPTGAYHYHGLPAVLTKGSREHNAMRLIGWAADGFPIYGPHAFSQPNNANSPIKTLKASYRIKKGERPGGPGGKHDGTFVADYEFVKGAGDLDECNGRYGVTPEFPKGTYYYVVTEEFPFIPRFWKGAPDPSFERKGPPGGRPPGGPHRPLGREKQASIAQP